MNGKRLNNLQILDFAHFSYASSALPISSQTKAFRGEKGVGAIKPPAPFLREKVAGVQGKKKII